MKIRPVAATAAAAALLLGSAGYAAASDSPAAPAASTPAASTSAPAAKLKALSLHAQSGAVGQQTFRLSGADRYATAVEVSSATFEPEYTYAVFLASGESYPDALVAGPASTGVGPLLLTARDTLPTSVAGEIERLQPCVVIVVGGTSAVSDRVAQQADALAGTDTAKCSAG